MRKVSRYTWIIAALVLITGTALITFSFLGNAALKDIPTRELGRGEFQITAIESGEIQAAGGELIMSPRIGGRLKIIYLWPEGEQVDVGDLVLQFDTSDFESEMMDDEGELEQANADFARSQAQQEQRLADLETQIEQQEVQFELAKLNLQSAKLGSPIDHETTKIELEKARRGQAEIQSMM